MVKSLKRFDAWLLNSDPTIGAEIKKPRPAIIISPDVMNQKLQTVIVAPLTSTIKKYPSRISSTFNNKQGEIMLDQLRTVDKNRLFKKIGSICKEESIAICQVLEVMFSY